MGEKTAVAGVGEDALNPRLYVPAVTPCLKEILETNNEVEVLAINPVIYSPVVDVFRGISVLSVGLTNRAAYVVPAVWVVNDR